MLFREQSLLHNPQGQNAAFLETFILRFLLGIATDLSLTLKCNGKFSSPDIIWNFNITSILSQFYLKVTSKLAQSLLNL